MSIPNSSIEPELNSLLTKLVDELKKDQAEIDVRKKRIEKNEALLRAVRASLSAQHPERKMNGYGSKAETIRDAISRISSAKFTQDDVEAEISKLNPEMDINRDRIRSALWTMSKAEDFIVQVSKGSNRQKAEFEKVNPPTNRAINSTIEAHRTAYGVATSTGVITRGDLEKFVLAKNRRIKDVVAKFKVDESAIRKLLEDPNTKVYEGQRGWLKHREEAPKNDFLSS